MSLISVIIPTYNRLEQLHRAVQSVTAQTYANFEIIIIDDGSDDETFSMFNKKKYPIIYCYQPNSGVSAARNRGIELSKSKYIALLDSDDMWKPEKLEKQIAFMEQNPEVMISQTNEQWIRNGEVIKQRKHQQKESGNIFHKSLETCAISPSTVMMKRQFFDSIGVFDEELPVCEDYDLWIRATSRMDVPLIEDELTIKHAGHDDQLSSNFKGIDRYRVYALQKLLSEPISPDQKSDVKKMIRIKCSYMLKGALKRKRFFSAIKLKLIQRIPALKININSKF